MTNQQPAQRLDGSEGGCRICGAPLSDDEIEHYGNGCEACEAAEHERFQSAELDPIFPPLERTTIGQVVSPERCAELVAAEAELAALRLRVETVMRERDAARQEVQRVRETSNRRKADMYKANRQSEAYFVRASAAEARVRELEAGLEFYADPDTYAAIGFFPDRPCGDFIHDFSDEFDPGFPKPGQRARSLLTKETTDVERG